MDLALSLQRHCIWLLRAPLFWWQNAASQSRGLFRREVRLNSSAISSGCRKKCSYLFGIQQKGGKNVMIEQTTSQNAHKKGLQRQIRQTRDSLRDTVEQIQDTAEEKYQAVKKTVSDVLDYREEFKKEPVVWTLGALCAGFATGYT